MMIILRILKKLWTWSWFFNDSCALFWCKSGSKCFHSSLFFRIILVNPGFVSNYHPFEKIWILGIFDPVIATFNMFLFLLVSQNFRNNFCTAFACLNLKIIWTLSLLIPSFSAIILVIIHLPSPNCEHAECSHRHVMLKSAPLLYHHRRSPFPPWIGPLIYIQFYWQLYTALHGSLIIHYFQHLKNFLVVFVKFYEKFDVGSLRLKRLAPFRQHDQKLKHVNKNKHEKQRFHST